MRITGNDLPRGIDLSRDAGQVPRHSGVFHGVNSFEDHRIAMVFGILRSALKLNFEITNPECVAKSWPEFWLDLADLEGTLRRVSSVIVRKSPSSPREIPTCRDHFTGQVSPFVKGGGAEFLIVKKPRKTHAWQFPQGGTEGVENGIAAAQRELAEECGENLKIKFLFDQPVGKYKYFFPADFKRHKEEFRGARVRFFLTEFVSGKVEIDPAELEDYKWVTKEELQKHFEKDYWEAVRKFL
jgi:8-oxo-dGTP pyrophosphatase MutT (NUDIX family)